MEGMNTNKPLPNEHDAWAEIANASDQSRRYFDWCRSVLATQSAGNLSIHDAADMISSRQDTSAFSQLEQNADVQIVMDYASGIADGAAYIGAENSLQRDWNKIAEIVQRHQ